MAVIYTTKIAEKYLAEETLWDRRAEENLAVP